MGAKTMLENVNHVWYGDQLSSLYILQYYIRYCGIYAVPPRRRKVARENWNHAASTIGGWKRLGHPFMDQGLSQASNSLVEEIEVDCHACEVATVVSGLVGCPGRRKEGVCLPGN